MCTRRLRLQFLPLHYFKETVYKLSIILAAEIFVLCNLFWLTNLVAAPLCII